MLLPLLWSVPLHGSADGCKKAFFHREMRDLCPIKELDSEHPRCVRQVYNPFLQVWTSADACFIEWKGEQAILLTCYDITELKRDADRDYTGG